MLEAVYLLDIQNGPDWMIEETPIIERVCNFSGGTPKEVSRRCLFRPRSVTKGECRKINEEFIERSRKVNSYFKLKRNSRILWI